MRHQHKIKIKEHQLWDFTLKEVCMNMGISKFDFIMDNKRYKSFVKRVEYFLKKSRGNL